MARFRWLLLGALGAAVAPWLAAKHRGPQPHGDGSTLAQAPKLLAMSIPGEATSDVPNPWLAAHLKRTSALTPDDETALLGQLDFNSIRSEGAPSQPRYVATLLSGGNVELTLHPEYQKAAETVLRMARAPRGAIVVTALDGTILALAGRRSRDSGKTGTSELGLALDPWAPSASIFKLVTATALVRQGVSPHAKVCYHGGLRSVVASNLEDSRLDGPCQDLAFGVAHSQNAILGKLAYRHLGEADLVAAAADLGFTADATQTGFPSSYGHIEIPQAGTLEFARTAAGFTETYLSPIGGAILTSTIASGGLRPQPHLIAQDLRGAPRRLAPSPPVRTLDEPTALAVGNMMEGTCARGSAAKAFAGASYRAAGKTGTLSDELNAPDDSATGSGDDARVQYSWFVGYAPAEKPEVVVSVLLGNGESWWMKANQAAREVLDRTLGARKN